MRDLVKKLRDLLVDNQNFREPFLSLLYQLYAHPPTRNRKDIRLIRPTCPTDQDVARYFLRDWPEVRLDKVNNHEHAQGQLEEHSWGFLNCDSASATDNGIHIMYELVEHWLNARNGQQTSTVSPIRLSILIRAVLLHQIGHRLVVWWSYGLCDTPASSPISGEAGDYIEKCFFGGVLEGWWSAGSVGKFELLCEVGMESFSSCQILNGEICHDIDQKMAKRMQPLPLVHTFRLPDCTPDLGTIRRKLCPTSPTSQGLGSGTGNEIEVNGVKLIRTRIRHGRKVLRDGRIVKF